ncbi:MAG TPA: citrate/2-methylcitrate synthase [Thermoanaerobaculia bacterium]|nr:citrate/2-methylcitrate synthase [Thermoanaerobaculia bacterium]
MLLEFDQSGKDPEAYVRDRLAKKERVMGFGHRVYKTLDPRAAILQDTVEDLSEQAGQRNGINSARHPPPRRIRRAARQVRTADCRTVASGSGAVGSDAGSGRRRYRHRCGAAPAEWR